MTIRLTVRSEKAYRLARVIAEETGRPAAEVAVAALRAYGSRLCRRDGMTPAQRATYEQLRALSRETAKRNCPGATSDYSDLYHEFGLPR